jgi:hypothetical protein
LEEGNALIEILVFGPALAIAGAASAAGSVAMTTRAERRELRGPSGDAAEADLAENQERELLGRAD